MLIKLGVCIQVEKDCAGGCLNTAPGQFDFAFLLISAIDIIHLAIHCLL